MKESWEKYLLKLGYNHLGVMFHDIKKSSSFRVLMRTSQEMIQFGLPIKCLEAVLVATFLTNGCRNLDRIRERFLSEEMAPLIFFWKFKNSHCFQVRVPKECLSTHCPRLPAQGNMGSSGTLSERRPDAQASEVRVAQRSSERLFRLVRQKYVRIPLCIDSKFSTYYHTDRRTYGSKD